VGLERAGRALGAHCSRACARPRGPPGCPGPAARPPRAPARRQRRPLRRRPGWAAPRHRPGGRPSRHGRGRRRVRASPWAQRVPSRGLRLACRTAWPPRRCLRPGWPASWSCGTPGRASRPHLRAAPHARACAPRSRQLGVPAALLPKSACLHTYCRTVTGRSAAAMETQAGSVPVDSSPGTTERRAQRGPAQRQASQHAAAGCMQRQRLTGSAGRVELRFPPGACRLRSGWAGVRWMAPLRGLGAPSSQRLRRPARQAPLAPRHMRC